jgi:hypothetical protein
MASWWSPLQQTFSQWSEHKDARIRAPLAYARRLTLHKRTLVGGVITGSQTSPENTGGEYGIA